jgi:sialate O-acetylesterase
MGYIMQVNAPWTLGVIDYESEIAAANYPNIRINRPASNPQYVALENNSCSWSECSPSTIANFPAVPYYFARQLYNNANINIPIGLLVPAVGGSSVQSWTRREAGQTGRSGTCHQNAVPLQTKLHKILNTCLDFAKDQP